MSRFVVIALLIAGCDVVDIDLVTLPDGGGFQPPVGPACSSSSSCLAGQLCEKDSCGAALGHCVLRPAFCDGDSRPECGCDGITYWNDCLRRAAGIESREPGPCQNPRACDTATPCPEGALCGSLLRPGECGRRAAGSCFVLPETCVGPMPDHFISCDPLVTQCLDACAAIRSGQAAVAVHGPCP